MGALVLKEMVERIRDVHSGAQKLQRKQMKDFQREKELFLFSRFQQGEPKLMVKVTGKLISPRVSQNPKDPG